MYKRQFLDWAVASPEVAAHVADWLERTAAHAVSYTHLDVYKRQVYNHTAEGNHMGPTLAFRGIDNDAYYRLVSGDLGHYYDTTGTGNSLLMRLSLIHI